MKTFSLEEIGAFGEEIITPKNEGLQRTHDWLLKRAKCYTGSENHKLMACGQSTSRQPWGNNVEKLVDFSLTAEKYIYNVGRERVTGLLSMETKSQRMEHGKDSEPLLIEQLLKDGVITDFEERGFEKYYEFGGASVDGIANYKGRKVFLEAKCTTSFDGEFMRLYKDFDEKHNDFWQINSEGLAVGLTECLYVVAAPMQVEIYDHKIVKCSNIHQLEHFKRCKIADRAIELWPKHGYEKALQVACAEYREEFNHDEALSIEMESPQQSKTETILNKDYKMELEPPINGISEDDLPF